ncbi:MULTISPECIES: hypothetical protein [unclassified Imperialibacter]|nr:MULTISPECIES: hypothetical protein [unclassified Imperialibacter]CAD5276931.1 hypothetical protein IMPERIA89_420026 [Imperialibacter sp. 89]CAD5295270.1 hypothetical protein IMPERIA75_690026 [Imperialibacter sp. 75]
MPIATKERGIPMGMAVSRSETTARFGGLLRSAIATLRSDGVLWGLWW